MNRECVWVFIQFQVFVDDKAIPPAMRAGMIAASGKIPPFCLLRFLFCVLLLLFRSAFLPRAIFCVWGKMICVWGFSRKPLTVSHQDELLQRNETKKPLRMTMMIMIHWVNPDNYSITFQIS